MNEYIDAWKIRSLFCAYLSDMYAKEVPLYKTLMTAVQDVNKEVILENPELGLNVQNLETISAERHGAIRLGKPEELKIIAQIFEIMNMYPVDFYDLTKAGAKRQPVISTAFRPISLDEIEKSSFRMFVSLLQPDDKSFFTEEIAQDIKKGLDSRNIFSFELIDLLEKYKKQGGFIQEEVNEFIHHTAQVFHWSGKTKNRKLYNYLVEHGLLIAADISCFPNPHLNHLTPNSLNISRLYAFMKKTIPEHLKDSIEGPSERNARILLRQTSYKALVEEVVFSDESENNLAQHKARFGEIEERGVAMTPKGRNMYEKALAEYMEKNNPNAFSTIPDSYEELRKEKLAFFLYEIIKKSEKMPTDWDELIEKGFVKATPLRYEDFLPVSAAGIFASNLGKYGITRISEEETNYSKENLESIMGKKIYDPYLIYEEQSKKSQLNVCKKLGIAT